MEVSEAPVEQLSSYASRPGMFSRRRFLALAAASIVGATVYAAEIAPQELQVTFLTVKISGLPEAFTGFRIVQLSDIHLEQYTQASFLKKALRQINRLQPDLVVLTGDFVSNSPFAGRFAIDSGYRCAEILKNELDCNRRYAVLGNHDVFVSGPAITEALVSHGIPVLRNNFVPIERDGARIWLAGLADALWDKPDPSLALPRQNASSGEPVILLCHEPDVADSLMEYKIPLMLSGHTHGGQVRVPGLPPPFLPILGRKYVEGYFSLANGTQLYVNRGLGTVGLPFRVWCPPETTVVTLAPRTS